MNEHARLTVDSRRATDCKRVAQSTDPWESDPRAVRALENPLLGRGGPAAVEIRCAVNERGQSCGRLLGTVHDTGSGHVLTVHFWPGAALPSARNRRELVVFLRDAGDSGMYTCQVHGGLEADIDAVRHRVDEGLAIGHPRMVLPVGR